MRIKEIFVWRFVYLSKIATGHGIAILATRLLKQSTIIPNATDAVIGVLAGKIGTLSEVIVRVVGNLFKWAFVDARYISARSDRSARPSKRLYRFC